VSGTRLPLSFWDVATQKDLKLPEESVNAIWINTVKDVSSSPVPIDQVAGYELSKVRGQRALPHGQARGDATGFQAVALQDEKFHNLQPGRMGQPLHERCQFFGSHCSIKIELNDRYMTVS
jgi:hypothetical protein